MTGGGRELTVACVCGWASVHAKVPQPQTATGTHGQSYSAWEKDEGQNFIIGKDQLFSLLLGHRWRPRIIFPVTISHGFC